MLKKHIIDNTLNIYHNKLIIYQNKLITYQNKLGIDGGEYVKFTSPNITFKEDEKLYINVNREESNNKSILNDYIDLLLELYNKKNNKFMVGIVEDLNNVMIIRLTVNNNGIYKLDRRFHDLLINKVINDNSNIPNQKCSIYDNDFNYNIIISHQYNITEKNITDIEAIYGPYSIKVTKDENHPDFLSILKNGNNINDHLYIIMYNTRYQEIICIDSTKELETIYDVSKYNFDADDLHPFFNGLKINMSFNIVKDFCVDINFNIVGQNFDRKVVNYSFEPVVLKLKKKKRYIIVLLDKKNRELYQFKWKSYTKQTSINIHTGLVIIPDDIYSSYICINPFRLYRLYDAKDEIKLKNDVIKVYEQFVKSLQNNKFKGKAFFLDDEDDLND